MVQALYMLLPKKVQEEPDLHVKDRTVNKSDLKNLFYLQAAVKEALRLAPPTPLLALRESLEDCLVGGFHVPAGTRLMVNLWTIHHDPRVRNDPEMFRPERFLGSDVDVGGGASGSSHLDRVSESAPASHLRCAWSTLPWRACCTSSTYRTHPDSRYDVSSPLGSATVLQVLSAPRLEQGLYGS
ncbi:unnamed protein product [Victoria cruziana]